MITSRTKKQLLVFVVITLVGVAFVGAKYARLDRLVFDTDYTVNAQFKQSGGIFTGAEVTYRGVRVGKVSKMKLTKDGVDVVLSIQNLSKNIPKDTIALVGNKSAVGEQYVELQPKRSGGPYLREGSTIPSSDSRTPISTTELLTHVDGFVRSVPQQSLRTVVGELGTGFKGTGQSLRQIIDTSNAFIETANANFDTTAALIRDSNVVLRTQAAKSSAIRSFSRDLALFSGTLAGSDADLRRLIDNGSATAAQLRTFLEQNRVPLGQLINNLVTTGEITVRYLPGLRQILVMYPYIVAGGFSAVEKTKSTKPEDRGSYDARFGLVFTSAPAVCEKGYVAKRDPTDLRDVPMAVNARCAEAATSNPRGVQNAPRVAPGFDSPVLTYDRATGKVTWTDQDTSPKVVYDGGAEALYGKDSWKNMLLQPTMSSAE